MATPRRLQKDLEALRREMAALRADYEHLKRPAAKAAGESGERLSAIKEEIVETVSDIRDKLAGRAGDAVDDIAGQVKELRDMVDEYTEQGEKAVAAHPLAAVLGAVAIGYLVGRLAR